MANARLAPAWVLLGLGAVGHGVAACGDDTGDGSGGGHPAYASATAGSKASAGPTGTTAATVGPSSQASNVASSTAAGSNPSPDPLAPFLPAECAELDPSQPAILYLSADDSNSMASPARARAQFLQDQPGTEIRTFEFLNYYRIDYPAPPYPDVAIYPDLKPGSAAGEFDLQIGVRSFDPPPTSRAKTITFVLDTSGSMAGERLEREKAAVSAIASRLVGGDIVNVVTWNDDDNIALEGHVITGPGDPTLAALVANLEPSGSTNLNGGLTAGYAVAAQHYGPTRLNRVVLITDGLANVGITQKELIAAHSFDADQEGIYLVGIAVGPGGDDIMVDVVTDHGRGASIFLDSVEEAHQMLAVRFDEVMEVAARGVQVELTLPWYFQMQEFFGEEFSESPEEIEPQHLAPGDAMVFSQIIRACDPGVVDGGDTVRVRARWTTPLFYTEQETEVEVSLDSLLRTPSPALVKGKAIVGYAEALKTPTQSALQDAFMAAIEANPTLSDPDLNEIAGILSAHPNF